MRLKHIYSPIEKELAKVEKILRSSLGDSGYGRISDMSEYLLDAKGKRLRPALVIFSAKAASARRSPLTNRQLTDIAAAMELIHMASLIHDDVIDHATLRHNKPTVNRKWGSDVSIALGDYLYAVAFELISRYGYADILGCISSAAKAMCEGELIQVCERDNLDLLRQRYIMIVRKKTASLFAASCRAGAMLTNHDTFIQEGLREYGMNFGIAFQIADDCLDLIGRKKDLGKEPGADFKMGELTLPALNLVFYSAGDKKHVISLLAEREKKEAFEEIRDRFINSTAFAKTGEVVSSYIDKAKNSLNALGNSAFKRGLFDLADYVAEKVNSICYDLIYDKSPRSA